MAIDNTLNVEITSTVDGLKKGLVKAEKGLKGFDTAVGRTTQKTNKMGKQLSTNAVPALTSFSQVVQDAPFGIQGVANNITQLTAQFGNLSTASGGAKNALKGMISSLAGPAGILLAISVVTSLMVSYGKEMKEFISGTDQAKLSTERLNDSLRAQIGLRKLLKDELSIATSIAVAEAKLAGQSAEEQFAVREKFGKANIKILQTQLEEAKSIRNKFRKDNQLELQKGNEELLDLQKGLRKDVVDIEKSIRDAQSQLRLDGLNEQIRIQEQSKNATKTFQAEVISNLQTFKSSVAPIAQEINDTIINSIPTNQQITLRTSEMLAALADFNAKAGDLIQGSIANTFSDIGVAVGEAMGNGGDVLQAFGSALIQGLGNFLKDFGKLMIQYGVAALAYSVASKALLNPITAAPAAIALIAAGTILSAVGGAIGSLAGGGGSSDTSTDFSGGSTFTGGSSGFSGGSSGGGTFVFEIAGTKLIGVLKNTLDRNRALGGSDNLLFG